MVPRMETEDTFSGRLITAMTNSRVSPIELSAATGGAFSARTIFRWRAGHTAPGIEAIPILCEQLEVSADWLLGCIQCTHGTQTFVLTNQVVAGTNPDTSLTERGT